MKNAQWLLLAATVSACSSGAWPNPPPVDRPAFLAAHAAWRSELQQSIGERFVGLAGLWLLNEGRTPFGTDSSLPIVLPGPGPRGLVGTFVRRGRVVQVEPARGHRLLSDQKRPIASTVTLLTEDDSVPTYLRFGSLRMWIHVQDERDYLRVTDLASPRLKGFTLAPEYEPDPRWRVAARLKAYRERRVFRLADVTGAEQHLAVPGELEFHLAGREMRLEAFAEPSDPKWLWLMFKDSTNRLETYPAGRYLWVPVPDSTGWTTIDFNRAISPPCAYTAFATCPLPPEENRLAVRVEAGQKRPH